MKHVKKFGMIAVLAAATAVLGPTLAAAAGCNTTMCWGPVQQVRVTESATWIQLGDGSGGVLTTAPTNCSFTSGSYWILPTSTNEDRIYASLLAARASQETVWLRMNDSESDCTITYIKY